MKIVIWKDGTYKLIEDGITHEFENDENWLTTISLEKYLPAAGVEEGNVYDNALIDFLEDCAKSDDVDGEPTWIKRRAKEILSNHKAKEGNGDAIEFAQWCSANDYVFDKETNHWDIGQYENEHTKYATSQQLYELFKSQPPKPIDQGK